DRELDAARGRARVPLLDRLRHDLAQRVAVVFYEVEQYLLEPRVELRGNGRLARERRADLADFALYAEPQRRARVCKRGVQVGGEPLPEIVGVRADGGVLDHLDLERAAPRSERRVVRERVLERLERLGDLGARRMARIARDRVEDLLESAD